MKDFLKQLQKNCISGIIVLLPLIVFFIILRKVWSFFQKYGEKAANLFGLDEIFGVFTRDIIGGLFILVLIYFSGYLIRLAFLKRFTNWIDKQLMIFLPGYEKSKKMAEESINAKIKTNTNQPILLKINEFWQPAFLVEEDNNTQKAVVYIPMAPFKDKGQIYIVPITSIKRLPNTTLAAFEEIIKQYGQGLLAFT